MQFASDARNRFPLRRFSYPYTKPRQLNTTPHQVAFFPANIELTAEVKETVEKYLQFNQARDQLRVDRAVTIRQTNMLDWWDCAASSGNMTDEIDLESRGGGRGGNVMDYRPTCSGFCFAVRRFFSCRTGRTGLVGRHALLHRISFVLVCHVEIFLPRRVREMFSDLRSAGQKPKGRRLYLSGSGMDAWPGVPFFCGAVVGVYGNSHTLCCRCARVIRVLREKVDIYSSSPGSILKELLITVSLVVDIA